jgi:hypothetical protein
MPYPKGFGVSKDDGDKKNYTSRTTNFNSTTADLTDEYGRIRNQVVTGAVKEVQEEYFCDDPAAFESPVVNGQTGEKVTTAATVTETAADWAKVSVTRRELVPVADEKQPE